MLFGVEDSKAPKDIPGEWNYLSSKCVRSEQHCLWDTMPCGLVEIYKHCDRKGSPLSANVSEQTAIPSVSDLPVLRMETITIVEDITSRRVHSSCSSP
jgi:hypothetical protein